MTDKEIKEVKKLWNKVKDIEDENWYDDFYKIIQEVFWKVNMEKHWILFDVFLLGKFSEDILEYNTVLDKKYNIVYKLREYEINDLPFEQVFVTLIFNK